MKKKYFALTDEGRILGFFETNASYKVIEESIQEYKRKDEYYNTDGFVKFIQEKGYEIKSINFVEFWF